MFMLQHSSDIEIIMLRVHKDDVAYNRTRLKNEKKKNPSGGYLKMYFSHGCGVSLAMGCGVSLAMGWGVTFDRYLAQFSDY